MYSLLQPLVSQRECLHGHQTRGVGYLGVSAGEREQCMDCFHSHVSLQEAIIELGEAPAKQTPIPMLMTMGLSQEKGVRV